MHIKSCFLDLLGVTDGGSEVTGGGGHDTGNGNESEHHGGHRYHVAVFDFQYVKTHFVVAIWILYAAAAKICASKKAFIT